MWWVPIAMFAKNKMDEARAKEEAKKQQLYQIRSQLAAANGAPGYGPQTAKSMYETQRQIDAQRRANNAQMMGSVFDSMSSFSDEEDPAAASERTPYEEAELERSRNALAGYR